jgi:hypothetical protein
VESVGELPISVTPIVAIVAVVAAIIAYRLRKRPIALALALVAVVAIGYAVAWTFMSV